jgi:hypothetical protein
LPMRVVKQTAESGEHNISSSPRMLYKESSLLYYSGILPLALSPQASHPPGRPHL